MSLEAGQKAPSFDLKTLTGENHSLADTLKKGPAVVVFFKTSCPTCQYTFPFLERLHKRFSGERVQVVGVSQDPPEDTAEFYQEYCLSFPMLIEDENFMVSSAYELHFVPSIFLIHQNGEIQISSEGFCKVDLLAIQDELSKVELPNSGPEIFFSGEAIPEYKPG